MHLYIKHVHVDECYVLVCASEFSKYGQHIRRGSQSSNGSVSQKTTNSLHFHSHQGNICVMNTELPHYNYTIFSCWKINFFLNIYS